MFNLESAISAWHSELLAAGIPADAAHELEAHLRDDISQQMQSGIDVETAFQAAALRIGPAAALKKEFSRNQRGAFFRRLKKLFSPAGEAHFPELAEFCPNARQVLELAPAAARGFHHNFTGTEHLLLAVTQSPSGIVLSVMQRLGLQSAVIRAEIEKLIHAYPTDAVSVNTPFTPRARKSLKLAAHEARLLHQPFIDAEHIFLGLLREGSGVAARVLKNLRVPLEKAREEVLRHSRTAN
jgi:hypothetical protein